LVLRKLRILASSSMTRMRNFFRFALPRPLQVNATQ